MVALILSLVSAYLIGSIPTSFIFGRVLKKKDIRKYGSGNVGATNVFRVVGKIPAVIVLALDVLKGVLAVSLLPGIFFNNAIGIALGLEPYRMLLGLSVIAGHVWSVFLKFKGGKGVATTAGVLLALAPKVLVGGLTVWVITFSLFRIVSVASIISSISLPVFGLIFREPVYNILFYVFLCVMGAYKHKANIRRLLRGTEKRLFLFLLSFFMLASHASAENLHSRFKDNPEIKVYLKEVTSDVKEKPVNVSIFGDAFRKTLPTRVNIKFKEARRQAGADVVITAKIKRYVFKEKVLPSLFSTWAVIADVSAPKSAALLAVDYEITSPADGELLAEFKNFTTNERRPKSDMVGDKAFVRAANKNINRFLYRAFYKQRPKRQF